MYQQEVFIFSTLVGTRKLVFIPLVDKWGAVFGNCHQLAPCFLGVTVRSALPTAGVSGHTLCPAPSWGCGWALSSEILWGSNKLNKQIVYSLNMPHLTGLHPFLPVKFWWVWYSPDFGSRELCDSRWSLLAMVASFHDGPQWASLSLGLLPLRLFHI